MWVTMQRVPAFQPDRAQKSASNSGKTMLKMTHAIYLVSDVDIAQQFLGSGLGLLVTTD